MRNARIIVAVLFVFVMMFCFVACGDTDVQDDTPQTFTIYFYPDNGTTIEPIIVKEGETVVLPENPVKEGWVFAGWMIDDDLKTAFEEGQAITSDICLYARWEKSAEPVEYALTFIVDGSEYAHYDLLPGTTVTLPNEPEKQCHVFVGWSLDESAQSFLYPTDMPEKNVVLYAIWEEAHAPVTDVGYAASCIADGLSDGCHCESCNTIIEEQQKIPATGHGGGEETCEHGKICTTCGVEYTKALGHIGGSATCTERAVCTRCGNAYGSALGHDEIEHSAKTPSCTGIGWNAYVTCSRCDYTTYQELSVLGHAGGVETCEHGKICTSCGEEYSKALGHIGGSATCVKKAICTRCGNEYGDFGGHDLQYHPAEEATCTGIGFYEYYMCVDCGHAVGYEEIPSLGHDTINHEAKAPTCTEIGWYAYETCSRCKYTTYQEREALGHSEVMHEGKEPTCTDVGWDIFVSCSRCEYTTYREIPAKGHKPADIVMENYVDETCCSDGSYDNVVYCLTCEVELSRKTEIIESQGHNLTKYSAKEPTCTDSGWYAYETCSRCEYTNYQARAALGHDTIKHSAQAPTCTAIGWDEYVTCSRCDYSTYSVIGELGHNIISHSAKEPTCTEVGWSAYETCSRCEHTTYHEIAAKGHENAKAVVENYVDETCLSDGSYDSVVYCSRCEIELSREAKIIESQGHIIANHPAKEPTCTEVGWDAYEACSRCEYTTRKEIDSLGHDEISHDAQKQTCTEVGWDEYVTCSRCDYTTYTEIPCHDYDENEHCVNCGYFDCGLLLELNPDGESYSVIGIRKEYEGTDIEISPVNYDTKPITAIADNAFSTTNIEIVILGKNITTIGANAFADCASLVAVLIANNVEYIGENAFLNCEALIEVALFETDNWLLIEYANEYSNPLCYDADLYIVDEQLENDVVVKEITIPTAVEAINFEVLATCKSLQKVNVEAGHSNYQSKDGVVYDAKGGNILFVPIALSGSVELLDGLYRIEEYAFAERVGLTEIIIPNRESISDLHPTISC